MRPKGILLAIALVATGPVRAAEPELRGVVAAATAEAAFAGETILLAGGNAVDAAVAVAFALAVTEPAGSGLFGQTMLLVDPAEGEPVVVHGSTRAPAAVPARVAPSDLVGRRLTTVPATVRALDTAWRRYGSGRIGWAELLAPAIRYAEEGFDLGPFRRRALEREAERLRRDPAAARLFLEPDGRVPDAARPWRQPRLARTLRRLAEGGADEFYRGSIARAIAADMEAHGGWLRLADLEAMAEVPVVPPLRGRYRDLDVLTLPPPAGGWVVLFALRLLEAVPASVLARDEAARTVWIAETLRRAHAERERAPLADLERYEDELARRLAPAKIEAVARGLDPPGGETTHFTVVDAAGTVVAVTASLNGYFGARVAHPELGILYNDYMRELVLDRPDDPYALRPGARPYSSMSATILERDGRPVLGLGSPGSRRIVSAVVQTIRRWVDGGVDLAAAVSAPRLHALPDGRLLAEAGVVPAGAADELRRRGFVATPLAAPFGPGPLDPYFGGVHAVALENGRWRGAADPRRDGVAVYAWAAAAARR